MQYILVGKIVNTHALKGEVRLISKFEYKYKVFIVNKKLYVGDKKEEFTIESYRKHKGFDMIKFKEINSINDALCIKSKNVYSLKDEFHDIILDDDLKDLPCYYNNIMIGKVKEIINNNGYKVFNIDKYFIPYNNNFIEYLSKEKIVFKNIKELLDYKE
ncbi:MAG: hypothetical protein RR255_04285 [Bacilli bacterium]